MEQTLYGIFLINSLKNLAVSARIIFPKSYLKLSAGRETMSDELQAICFFAGVNSIFVGKKLLTVNNSRYTDDLALLKKLGFSKD